jgi:hypothetical protein
MSKKKEEKRERVQPPPSREQAKQVIYDRITSLVSILWILEAFWIIWNANNTLEVFLALVGLPLAILSDARSKEFGLHKLYRLSTKLEKVAYIDKLFVILCAARRMYYCSHWIEMAIVAYATSLGELARLLQTQDPKELSLVIHCLYRAYVFMSIRV